jgi:hydroxymethylpyrimidine/phosphomethylpyrimidine kinase
MARDCDAADALRAAQEYTSGALASAQRFGMGKYIPNKFYRAAPAAPLIHRHSSSDHEQT